MCSRFTLIQNVEKEGFIFYVFVDILCISLAKLIKTVYLEKEESCGVL